MADYFIVDEPFRFGRTSLAGSTRADAIRRAEQILRAAGVKFDLVPRHPEWKAGDVVVVFYGPNRAPYTYVRGKETWPADGGREPKTDAFINKLYDEGRVKPLLQAGGVPFVSGRL
ncbi:hypothetical protein [Micromonospora sp. WMMD980]|uniref:hypothetical protein n=1 Tax=Micromonospora sp. WMMD980 TaxID=3016088 RepID=UPI002417AB38|nr:hypothetical protein [Micromonospora sp. WMMD980]MDG4801734.1 hypothetical protein [Micromonospora sp. WMMD980]